MNNRFLRHLFASPWAVRRHFPADILAAIEGEIRRAEQQHGGELRFAVEGSLDAAAVWSDITPRERAMQVFSALRMWDTATNSGVLIYVLLADRAVEIVADRGHGDISAAHDWLAACRAMERWFAKGDYKRGAIEGIATVAQLVARRFPAVDRNELPDTPILL